MRLSKEAGARIALLTAHPENEHGKLADLCVHVPGQIFGGSNEVKSIQPMASLLEQALFLFTDIVVMLLMARKGFPFKQCRKAIRTWKVYPASLSEPCSASFFQNQ